MVAAAAVLGILADFLRAEPRSSFRDHLAARRAGSSRRVLNRFHRLPTGGIHFQELPHDAAARELSEEYGLAVRVGRRLGVMESLLMFEGQAGHGTMLIYEADVVDPTARDFDRWPAETPTGFRRVQRVRRSDWSCFRTLCGFCRRPMTTHPYMSGIDQLSGSRFSPTGRRQKATAAVHLGVPWIALGGNFRSGLDPTDRRSRSGLATHIRWRLRYAPPAVAPAVAPPRCRGFPCSPRLSVELAPGYRESVPSASP